MVLDYLPSPLVQFEPFTLHIGDVLPAVDFIIVGTEASREDKVKNTEFLWG